MTLGRVVWVWVLLAIVTTAVSGCLPFVVPTSEYAPSEFPSRGMVEADAFDFLRVGSTVREEVLLRLGEPDATWEDEAFIAYRWWTVSGVAGVIGLRGGSSDYVGEQGHDFVIELDDDGIVTRFGLIDEWASTGPWPPGDPLAPALEVPIVHRHTPGRDQAATLVLGGGIFEFREPAHSFTTPLDAVITLTPSNEGRGQWQGGQLSYTLRFSESTEVGDQIGFRLDVSAVPDLVEFVMSLPSQHRHRY